MPNANGEYRNISNKNMKHVQRDNRSLKREALNIVYRSIISRFFKPDMLLLQLFFKQSEGNEKIFFRRLPYVFSAESPILSLL